MQLAVGLLVCYFQLLFWKHFPNCLMDMKNCLLQTYVMDIPALVSHSRLKMDKLERKMWKLDNVKTISLSILILHHSFALSKKIQAAKRSLPNFLKGNSFQLRHAQPSMLLHDVIFGRIFGVVSTQFGVGSLAFLANKFISNKPINVPAKI